MIDEEAEPILSSPIANLPVEILQKIFKLLKFVEKRNSRLVCHWWRQILDDPYDENYVFKADIRTNDVLKYLVSSHRIINFLTLANITAKLPKDLPIIENVILEANNSGKNVIRLLKYGSDFVKYLKIHMFALEDFGFRDILNFTTKVQWNSLRYLEIMVRVKRVSSIGIKHAAAVSKFLKVAKLPALVELWWTFVDNDIGGEVASRKILVNLHNFIERHAAQIKSLQLNIKGAANFASTEVGEYEAAVAKSVQESLAKNLKLDFLIVSIQYNPLVLPCLLESTTLTTLLWDWQNKGSLLYKMLVANQHSIEVLEVSSSCFAYFHLSWLQNLSKLTSISIGYFENDTQISFPTVKNVEIITRRTSIQPPPNVLHEIAHSFPNLVSLWIRSPRFSNHPLDLEGLLGLPFLDEFVYWSWTNAHHYAICELCDSSNFTVSTKKMLCAWDDWDNKTRGTRGWRTRIRKME